MQISTNIKSIWNLCLLIILFLSGCSKSGNTTGEGTEEPLPGVLAPQAVSKSNKMKLYVHYMPWFEDKSTNNGQWGQHWTMGNKNPDNTSSDGKREIASYYYPLIGPYASSDADVIEYHLLLMKYAGIDGVLIDWYGIQELWDYPANKRNTEALVKAMAKVGMEFAIVYEDQTLQSLDSYDKVAQAKADMKYLENNFFNKDTYIKIDGKPLLMTFGPQQLKKPSEWTDIFGTLKTKPNFLALYGHYSAASAGTQLNAAGEYIWVDALSMETKYARKNDFNLFMGGAYPGFNAFYKDGGWGDNPLGVIPHQDGALFQQLLNMAKTQGMSYLQLITWNDFGEGTMIEPTREFGYRFLTQLQSFAGTSYQESVLKEVYRLYGLRKQYKNDKAVQEKLTQAFYYFVSLQPDKATQLMDKVAL